MDPWAALYSFWALALLARSRASIVLLRRRRKRAAVVLRCSRRSCVVLVTVLVTYASTRFRTTAEPSLVVLAAVAIDAAIAPCTLARQPRTTRQELVAVAGRRSP